MIASCEICGTEYYSRPSHYNRVTHHFCSKKCLGIGETGNKNHRWKDNNKNCEWCGKEYKPHTQRQKYCSSKCMGANRHDKNSVDVLCPICDKSFSVKRALYREGRNCCSIKCKDMFHSKEMDGAGNSNWLGGITSGEYGIEFNKKLKQEIRKRDNYVCRLCGLEDHSNFTGNGYGLCVHHIDYDKLNNDESNLISLCNHCHGKTNYNREKWKLKLSNLSSE